MLAAFIFLPARPPSLSCVFILEATFFPPWRQFWLQSDSYCKLSLWLSAECMNVCVLGKENNTDYFFQLKNEMSFFFWGGVSLWIRNGMNNCLREGNCFYRLQYSFFFLGCLLLLLAAPVNVLLFLLVVEVPIDFAIATPSGTCEYYQSC